MKYDKGDEKLLRKLIFFFLLFQSNEGERQRFFLCVFINNFFLSIVYDILIISSFLCEIILKGAIMNSLKIEMII